jgi:hypothetical protein
MVIFNEGESTCSGALLNNTAEDYRPYFLTAFHALDSDGSNSLDEDEKDAVNDWVFKFQYKMTTCDGSSYIEGITYNHATFRSAWYYSDFALLELVNAPLGNSEINWLGWDRSGNTPENVALIHHPQGDVMKISLDNDSPIISSPQEYQELTHWKVNDMDIGTSENGSSGAPLFDHNQRVTGQDHGGRETDYCNRPRIAYFGRLNKSWAGGHDSTSHLASWLNPTSSIDETLDALRSPNIYISGADPLCTSNRTYSVQNVPSAVNFISWSVFPENFFTNDNGTGSSFITAWEGLHKGNATVTATLHLDWGTVDITKELWIGTPGQPTTDPSGYPTIDMQLWGLLNVSLTNSPGATGMPVWWCSGSLEKDSENANSCTFEAVEEGTGNFYVKTQNACGYSPSAGGTVNVSTGGGGGTPDDPLEPLCYPNPVDEQVTVTLAEPEDAGGNFSNSRTQTKRDEVYEYQLYDLYYQLVREINTSQRKVQIKTNNLEEGFYFLKVVRGEKVWIKMIEVRH